LFLNNFFSTKINSKIFSVNNLRKILYFNGKQALLDLLYFQVFRSKKIDKKLVNFIELFKDEEAPVLPLKATTLITKYNIPAGKELGVQLKKVENKWIKNNFKISDEEIHLIIKN